MHDLILQISSCLTRSPRGEVDLSEISRRSGIDRRTLGKWLTTILIAQVCTPLIKPLTKHSIDRQEDARFASLQLCSKLLELFYKSYPDGRIKEEDVPGPATARFLRMELLKTIDTRGTQYLAFTDNGLRLALELRDLVNDFYEALLDVNLTNAMEVWNAAKRWHEKLAAFNSRLTDMAFEKEKKPCVPYFAPSKAAEIITHSIRDRLRWLMTAHG